MKKLNHYIKCTATIKALTGLHIGGSKEGLKIGGIDNPVIRNPITYRPYIPGSSLKGRFRMALELKYIDVNKESKGMGPSQDLNHESNVVRLFGSGNPKNTEEPTRYIFRDANLSESSGDFLQGETKVEVKIDRETLAAFTGGNRTHERIAAGAQFDFEVMIRIFDGDDEELFKQRLQDAMKIVELEFLGGSGTRGSGQVKFEEVKFSKIDI